MICLVVSLGQLDLNKADPRFSYYVPGAEQSLDIPISYRVPGYQPPVPLFYNNFPLIQQYNTPQFPVVFPPFYLNPCTNYLGLSVPCNVGGLSVTVPEVTPVAMVDSDDSVNFQGSEEVSGEDSLIIEARK